MADAVSIGWWAARHHEALGDKDGAADKRAMWSMIDGPFQFRSVVGAVQNAQDDGHSAESITSWFADAEEVDMRVITAAVRVGVNEDDAGTATLIENWFDDAGPIRRGVVVDMLKEIAQQREDTPTPRARFRLRDRFWNRLVDRR